MKDYYGNESIDVYVRRANSPSTIHQRVNNMTRDWKSDIKQKHIKKDAWVKEMTKAYHPEALADLIEKRITKSVTIGPYVQSHNSEEPTDIINAFIQHGSTDFRDKIEPAVGLLLYKMMHGDSKETIEMLKGIFSIIKDSRLRNCHTLVQNWIVTRASYLKSDDLRWKETYRTGMIAFARIQNPNEPAIEKFWFDIWRWSEGNFWWPSSFLGLRIQNPELACGEFPLLLSRKIEKTPYLLLGMWDDFISRDQLEKSIKIGLDNNSGWAGLVLNTLLEKLTTDSRDQLMSNLSEIK